MGTGRLLLESTTPLWLAAAIVAVCAVAALAGRRHAARSRAMAFALRGAGVLALGLVLAGPYHLPEPEPAPRPGGTWRLLLAPAPPRDNTTDFRESPDVFVARVRHALETPAPPQRCVVHGDFDAARATMAALGGLGVAVEHTAPERAGTAAAPALLGLDAPRHVQPGEPVQVALRVLGDAPARIMLDGRPLEARRVGDRWLADPGPLDEGRHVVEAELNGRGMGHVLRVGKRPALLMLGLDDRQTADVQRLTPDFAHLRCGVAEFDAGHAASARVCVTSVLALYRLSTAQSFDLAAWVGRGGGLFVTGDGARHVPPAYLADDVRALLPVRLIAESVPDKPEDPPVSEQPTIEEIAKVSVCYVLDRSNSMNAFIGNTRQTRWQVATRGVLESMARLSLDARASVMTFTLSQNWLHKPRVFFDHDRENVLAAQLRRAESDNIYDEAMYNTDIYAAVKAALDVIEKEPAAVKMIILLTDGADRPANAAAGLRHSDLRDRAVRGGVNIVAIGIGEEFAGDLGSAGAQAVIRDLATQPQFAFIAASPEDAGKANAIFVNSVSTAFRLFDEKKAREEAERRRKLEDLARREKEPPKVDALKGTWPIRAAPLGLSLFGPEIGTQSPRVQWYARHEVLPESAVALAIDAPADPAGLAFRSFGLGRCAFWSAGTRAEDLGEVASWAEFGGVFASSVRWLTPREVPDLALVRAGSGGIRLLDIVEGARWTARDQGGRELALELSDGLLRAPAELAPGAWEILEHTAAGVRNLGDVYIEAGAAAPAPARVLATVPAAVPVVARQPLPAQRRPAWHVMALLLGLFFALLPLERAARRRQ
ncbi:MAG: VWA domain-containing protein [Planctomycetes bacterium]|nr:VWA domain-containing protein [Planctomycetota bacterium]